MQTANLKAGSWVHARLMIKSVEKRLAKNGNEFLSGELFDKDGVYRLMAWNPKIVGIEDLAPGDLIEAEWKVDFFKENLQLDVVNLLSRTAKEDVKDADGFVRTSAVSEEEWRAYYHAHVEPLIEDKPIVEIIRNVLASRPFWQAAAAKAMHQNWVGGLAEHTHRILRMFVALTKSGHPTIEGCRKGLVIAGIILHDHAKASEYEQVAPGQFDTSRWGELVGHLAGGPIELAARMERTGIAMSPELRAHFFHVLLAHHGRVDWGSPIVPKTVEANIVHFLDNLDGKLSMIEETKDMAKNYGIGGKVVHYTEEDGKRP